MIGPLHEDPAAPALGACRCGAPLRGVVPGTVYHRMPYCGWFAQATRADLVAWLAFKPRAS